MKKEGINSLKQFMWSSLKNNRIHIADTGIYITEIEATLKKEDRQLRKTICCGLRASVVEENLYTGRQNL